MTKIVTLALALAIPAAAWAALPPQENTKFSPERMAEIARLM